MIIKYTSLNYMVLGVRCQVLFSLSMCWMNLAVNSGQLLVSNNREGTEERTRDVVEGYEGVASGLGQDNATCLSGAV